MGKGGCPKAIDQFFVKLFIGEVGKTETKKVQQRAHGVSNGEAADQKDDAAGYQEEEDSEDDNDYTPDYSSGATNYYSVGATNYD